MKAPTTPTQQQPPQQQEAPSGPKGGARENGEHGYPTSTPLTEMTVEQREAYWRHQSKKHEQTWKSVIDRNLTPEQVLEMQQRLDEVNRERMSDHEKQVADARREAAVIRAAGVAPTAGSAHGRASETLPRRSAGSIPDAAINTLRGIDSA